MAAPRPVIAAHFSLRAFFHGIAIDIDPQVHRCLAATLTDGLQFNKRIGNT